MKCFSDGRKYMKKWTLTEFFWKSKLAFFGLSDGTNFKILRRFFGFLLFFGRKTPPNSAELVLKKYILFLHDPRQVGLLPKSGISGT